jgi:hypothetical protein
MAGELTTLPLRVTLGATRLMLRTAEEIAVRAATVAGRAVQTVASRGSNGPPPRDARPRPATHVAVTEADVSPYSREDHATRPAPAEPEPAAHVSEEAELVREFAEPGAEEGAGADVTVSEPWQGYGRMTAKQVIERLGDATPAELAAVRLYESGNRSRQTVLTAVDRELKTNSGRARPE